MYEAIGWVPALIILVVVLAISVAVRIVLQRKNRAFVKDVINPKYFKGTGLRFIYRVRSRGDDDEDSSVTLMYLKFARKAPPSPPSGPPPPPQPPPYSEAASRDSECELSDGT